MQAALGAPLHMAVRSSRRLHHRPASRASLATPASAPPPGFYSVQGEQVEEIELPVVGKLPPWLEGALIRNGPGKFEAGPTPLTHLFDGFGLLTRFRLADGRAYASHRFVASRDYAAGAGPAGVVRTRQFGTRETPRGPLAWAAGVVGTVSGGGVTDNANVSVTPLPGGAGALACTETVAGTFRIDLDTLATAPFAWADSGGVSGSLTTAHGLPGPNGELLNLVTAPGFGYTLYRVRPGSTAREKVAFVTAAHRASPGWMHSFAVTETKALLAEIPLWFDLGAMLPGATVPPLFIGNWRPSDGTRLHVIDLGTGAVSTHAAPPLFYFHFANAADVPGGGLTADVCLYDDGPAVLPAFRLDVLRATPPPVLPPCRLARVAISGNGEVDIATLSPGAATGDFFELPRVSPTALRSPGYRFVYGVSAVRPTAYANALCKLDLSSHDTRGGPAGATIWHEPGSTPSEPVFVPRPGGATEDDGVVLSVVSGANGTASLLVLDGGTFAPLARAQAPHQLPASFHGDWFPRRGG